MPTTELDNIAHSINLQFQEILKNTGRSAKRADPKWPDMCALQKVPYLFELHAVFIERVNWTLNLDKAANRVVIDFSGVVYFPSFLLIKVLIRAEVGPEITCHEIMWPVGLQHSNLGIPSQRATFRTISFPENHRITIGKRIVIIVAFFWPCI